MPGSATRMPCKWSGRHKAPWGVLPAKAHRFRWTDSAWRTPPLRDLIIYEVCVRDAAGIWHGNRPLFGNFERLRSLIPHMVRTGVNAVELMPIQAFPGDSSWGYNPVFYHAIANTYGNPHDLKRFVNECHRNGIAVILDVAFNHAWGEHPYYQMYPPMYGDNGERWSDWNPVLPSHAGPASICGAAWIGIILILRQRAIFRISCVFGCRNITSTVSGLTGWVVSTTTATARKIRVSTPIMGSAPSAGRLRRSSRTVF